MRPDNRYQDRPTLEDPNAGGRQDQCRRWPVKRSNKNPKQEDPRQLKFQLEATGKTTGASSMMGSATVDNLDPCRQSINPSRKIGDSDRKCSVKRSNKNPKQKDPHQLKLQIEGNNEVKEHHPIPGLAGVANLAPCRQSTLTPDGMKKIQTGGDL